MCKVRCPMSDSVHAMQIWFIHVLLSVHQHPGYCVLTPLMTPKDRKCELIDMSMTHWLGCMQSDLHGMIPVVAGQFLSLQSDAIRWPNGLKQAAAVCNSLTLISKSKVVGELGERRAFNAVEAQFLVSIFCPSFLPCCTHSEHHFCPAVYVYTNGCSPNLHIQQQLYDCF